MSVDRGKYGTRMHGCVQKKMFLNHSCDFKWQDGTLNQLQVLVNKVSLHSVALERAMFCLLSLWHWQNEQYNTVGKQILLNLVQKPRSAFQNVLAKCTCTGIALV